MKRYISFFIFNFVLILAAGAQDFITRGKIEFEIKKNNRQIYKDQRSDFLSSLPEFDITYRDLIFAWNRSVYLPGRKSSTPSFNVNDNAMFTDLDQQLTVKKERHFDESYVYADSTKKVKWKIGQETRKIAGWNCRKAIGIISDSVYVVAFYCPEIVPQAGPEMFNGLPGMILGLAIPRLYTTWFATKIEIANIDEAIIIPPTVKKSKQYTKKELSELLFKKHKEAGWWKDATVEKVLQSLGDFLL